MRRVLDALVVLSLAAFAAWLFQPRCEAALYGTWTTRDGEKTVLLEFTPSHRVRLSLPGEGILEGRYSTDFSQVPPHITLEIEPDRKVETLLTIVSANEVRIMDNSPKSPCPSKMDATAYVLKRQAP